MMGDNGHVETVADLLAKFTLTDAEVGRLLSIRPETVHILQRNGHLPGVIIGGKLRWRPNDVQAYIEGLTAE